MKYIIKALFFLVAVVAISSCQKVVVLDLNTAESQIVIEGNISATPGEPQTVYVSTSGDFYTFEGIEAVDNATVIVKDQEGLVDTLDMYTAGIYFSNRFTGEENMDYSIEVWRDGEFYTGTETLPQKKLIDSLSYVVNEGLFGGGGLNEDGDSTYNILVRFQDPEETLDYYRVLVYLNDSMVQAGFNTYLIADDELFNGQLFTLEVLGSGAIKGDQVKIDFQSIGYNTFTYYVGLNDLLSGGLGSTPYNPISNLSNDALGYFGAYTTDSASLVIQ